MHSVWSICQQRVTSLLELASSASSRDNTGPVLLNGFQSAMTVLLDANPMIMLESNFDSKRVSLSLPHQENHLESSSRWQALHHDANMMNFRMHALCKGRTLPAAGAEAIQVTLDTETYSARPRTQKTIKQALNLAACWRPCAKRSLLLHLSPVSCSGRFCITDFVWTST